MLFTLRKLQAEGSVQGKGPLPGPVFRNDPLAIHSLLPCERWPLTVGQMSHRLRVVAISVAAATVVGGCGGVSRLVYRGHVNGVVMSVALAPKAAVIGAGQPTLAIRFTPAAAAIWRRARARPVEAFCIWPHKNGGGEMIASDVRLNTKRFSTPLGSISNRPANGAYTCGLHSRTGGAQGSYPWRGYVRGALVAAQLNLAND